jgi:FMN reductase
MPKVAIVVGNPKPQSRTARIAELLIGHLFDAKNVDLEVIDLAEHVDKLFTWPSQEMLDLNERVAKSDFAVFASPTYKATYTGLLKAFLDRYPANGLRGLTAIAVMTGADFNHSMAPTVNLIPLLLELGAIVPAKGLYFNATQFDQIDELVVARAEEVRSSFKSLTTVVDAIRASRPQVSIAGAV